MSLNKCNKLKVNSGGRWNIWKYGNTGKTGFTGIERVRKVSRKNE